MVTSITKVQQLPILELMRKHSGPMVQVKCAGGVRTLDDLLKMREAGATRSGATATDCYARGGKEKIRRVMKKANDFLL